MMGSSRKTFVKTFVALRELIPGSRRLAIDSDIMDDEREKICEMWASGRRSAAVEIAEKSRFQSTKLMLELLLKRATSSTSDRVFSELKHPRP